MSKGIDAVKEEYIGISMVYDGNDHIYPFMGTCIGVKKDTNGEILLQIRDMDDDVFDIELSDEKLNKAEEEN